MKLFLALLSACLASPSLGQQQKIKRIRAKDAVTAARLATTDEAKERAYTRVKVEDIDDDEDIRAIAEEISEIPKVFKGEKSQKNKIRSVKHLASVLAECRQPKHHAVIKELLAREDNSLGRNYMGPWGSKSEDEFERDTIKYEKLKALAEAAATGKNEGTLPVLRSMRRKGGQAGKMAETTIGQIGRDEDLDEFVKEIKSDPKSGVSLYGFGRKGLTRVVRELNNAAITEDTAIRLAGALPGAVSHDDLPAAVALLKHQNRRVVSVVGRMVANSLTSSDELLLRELLKNEDQAIRGPAILSINRNWDPKYIPILIEVLKKDPNDGNRAAVAHILAERKVKTSESVLRTVSTSDPVPWVREAAREAIQALSK